MRWILLASLLAAAPAAAQPGAPQAAAAQQGSTAAQAVPRDAASRYAGRPIEQVQVFVAGEATTDPSLTELLQTRVGQALSMADVRESIAHLYGMGRFQDVRVDATDTPSGGVSLRFELVPLRTVEDIAFTGNLGLSKGLLRRTITDRYGATPPFSRAADAVRLLESLYHDHGYLHATVKPVKGEGSGTGPTVLTFEIDAGPRASIGTVNIEGDPLTSPAAFQKRMRVEPGDPYEPPVLQERLDEFVRQLRQRGFYEATSSHRATVSEDGTSVNLTISVQPGPAVSVRFEGDPIPQDRLDELVPVKREASDSEDLLEDSVVAIRSYLQQQGYWKADASWRREEANNRLTLVFTIRKGLRYYLAEPVQISGNQAIPTPELRQLIAPKAGDVFVESALSLASAAITELYRQQGFVTASVRYTVVETDQRSPTEGLVRPTITITEGPRTLIGAVRISGNSALSTAELRPLVPLAEGQPYYEPQVTNAREALVTAYLNNGFASADVGVAPAFSSDRTKVDLDFVVQEGPRTTVDHILIVGNTHTDAQVILHEMRLQPGQPLGREDLVESQRALSALGLFRRVRITVLHHGSGTAQDVLVTVDEAPMTTIAYGGGIEASQRLRATGPSGEAREQLELAPRGFFNIGRRNVGGRNRTVDLYTRISLRPRDAPNDPAQDGTGLGFSEYRVVGTYREPRAFWGSDVVVTAATEQGIRSSFNFARKGVNADMLRRLTPTVRLSGRYSFSTTRTFDERLDPEDQSTIDRLFPQVRLSAISGAVARDTRDDVLEPHRGGFLSAEGSIAARSLGGQVGFVKTYLQAYWFRQLTSRHPIVLATRGAIGMADGFPRDAQPTDANGAPIPGPPVVIEDLPASERFFAGGDTSIRGFALDTVGAPGTISVNGFPRGGNAVVILNGELRVPVWGGVGAAFFADGGNVFARTTQLDLGELRGAVGFGLRYKSPVGPIRLDLGFKLDRREISGRLEPKTVWHFSIGEAF
jgi:outer membrane protein insertion porin family